MYSKTPVTIGASLWRRGFCCLYIVSLTAKNFGLPLDLLHETVYTVTRNKEVSIMTAQSRAEYFKERRSKFRTFSVEVERDKMERLETWLNEQGMTKTEWLNRKIDEVLGKAK